MSCTILQCILYNSYYILYINNELIYILFITINYILTSIHNQITFALNESY